MTRFYFLLSRVTDGLNKSSKTFETHLAAVGGEIVKEQAAKTSPQQCIAAAIPFIKKLMELYQKYVVFFSTLLLTFLHQVFWFS